MPDLPNQELTSTFLFRRSYALYGQRFWQYLKIAMFPALLLFLCVTLVAHIQSNVTLDFFKSMRTDYQRDFNFHLLFIELMYLLRFCAYWLTSALLFGAVASKVTGLPPVDGSHAEDSSLKVLSRSGGIIAVGAITFLPMFLFGSYLLPTIGAVVFNKPVHYSAGTDVLFRITQVVLAGLLSKFGLAIPALIDDPQISVSRALGHSWQATAKWETFFMLFLIKSSVLAYVSYLLARQGLVQLWQHMQIPGQYYPYASRATGILLGALIELPLFIAFCVLYSELKAKQETVSAMAAPAIR